MHRFGYSEIRREIPADIVSLVKMIAEINSKNGIREAQYRKEFESVKAIAMVASAKYSNGIEGIFSTDDRIRELVLRGGTPQTHDEQEIAGYRDALSEVHGSHSDMDFDERTVLALHRTVMRYTQKETGYKKRDNAVFSTDGKGRTEIAYLPVPASETAEAMEQLSFAYMAARDEGCEPLLLIPCVILDFLCIHPFADGNGRVSRLMTEVLLYNSGYDVCRYVSMDEHIYATRDEYYASLNASSAGWKENEFSYFPFVRYFLRTLLECYIDLDTRFSIVDGKKLKKKQRIEKVILESTEPVSKRQICFILPDVSPRTVDAAVEKFLADGKIVKVGSFKDARYASAESVTSGTERLG